MELASKSHPQVAPGPEARADAKALLNSGVLEAGVSALLVKCMDLRQRTVPDSVPSLA